MLCYANVVTIALLRRFLAFRVH